MKKVIALLVLSICLSSCKANTEPNSKPTNNTSENISENAPSETSANTDDNTEKTTDESTSVTSVSIAETSSKTTADEDIEFYSMDDPDFLEYVKTTISSEFEGDEFIVDSIQAKYMSDEYYENLKFNSQENEYFGYTVSDLNSIFNGNKYVFTLSDDGQTVVQEMEVLEEDAYSKMIENSLIGVGVIAICVTVTIVAPQLGIPKTIKTFFSFAARNAIKACINAIDIGSIIKGAFIGDFSNISKSDALAMTNDFKWGAIMGAVDGAIHH